MQNYPYFIMSVRSPSAYCSICSVPDESKNYELKGDFTGLQHFAIIWEKMFELVCLAASFLKFAT